MRRPKRSFVVVIEEDGDGCFVGSVPALPGCHTQARTLQELRRRIKEAILLCLEMAEEDPEYRRQIAKTAQRPGFVALEQLEV